MHVAATAFPSAYTASSAEITLRDNTEVSAIQR